MSVRRPVTSVLLAAAALALTACSSGGTTTAAGPSAAPATTAATAAPATSASAGAPAAKTSASATGKPSAKPVPAADCTAAAQPPAGHRVIKATVAWGGPDRIGASKTRFLCGKDVAGEGYWEAVPNSDETLYFASGATAQLLVRTEAKDVPVSRALQQIVACTTDNKASQGEYGCYANMYDITVDGSGKISRIASMYRP